MQVQNFFLSVAVLILFIFFSSCKPEEQAAPVKVSSVDEIIDADIAFSELSKKRGMKNSFIDFMDMEGILLRPGHFPIKGADAIEFLSEVDDSPYVLSWVPEGAQIAGSGDMGFTFGIYTLEASDTVFKGTYVNIWKKQANGNWKFVMNTTNQGINSDE